MDKKQHLAFKDWEDYWACFNSFCLLMQNSGREQVSTQFREAKLHVNGMTDGWFEFTGILEKAIYEHEMQLTEAELSTANKLMDFVKKPLTRQ